MPKVPIGPTTLAGYSVTLAGVILAVLAYANGDRSESTVGTIVAGAVAAIAFLVTQVGRYVQAKALIKYGPPPSSSSATLQALPDAKAVTMPPAGMVFPTSSTAILEPADVEDELEPRDELDERAAWAPLTESPPPDEGDAGDPLAATATGGPTA